MTAVPAAALIMNPLQKPSARLARLDRILAQSPGPIGSRSGTETDPEQVHLTSVPLERIQALTTELLERTGPGLDDLDAITMRLLLNEYKVAVAHLRAVANRADARLHTAAAEIHESRKTVRRHQEMAMKQDGKSLEAE